MRRLLLFAFVSVCAWAQGDTLQLTLSEAERIAVRNNPAITSAAQTANALGQVPTELHSSLEPNVAGLVTGVGAD